MADSPILGVSNVILPNEPNRVDNSVAENIEKVGDLLIEVGAQHIEGNLQEDLTEASDEAVLAEAARNQAANQPLTSDVIATILGDKGGAAKVDEDPTMRPFLEKLAKSKQAERQGSISGTELKIRHEQILREYVARHPRMASRFIQAAGQSIGYNPIGSEIDAIFDPDGSSKDGAPKDPRSYIEKQYDQLADELNIDPTEKYTDPIAWYKKVEKEATYKEKLDSDTMRYQRTVLTRQVGEEDALVQVRGFAANKARDILGQVRGFINQLPTSSSGQAQGIDAGSLQAAKDSILAGKAAFVQQITEMSNGIYGNEWVNTNLGHINAYFDYAAQQADPKKAMDDINRALEAQVATGLYLKFPNFKTQEAVIKLISQIPADSPLGASLSASLSSQVWSSMATQLGAAWDAAQEDGPPPEHPPNIVPPPITQNNTSSNNTRIQLETVRGMRGILENALKQPANTEQRRIGTLGAIRTVAATATEYLNTKATKAPAKSVIWEMTSLAASDEFKAALKEPGISVVEKGLMTQPIDDALTSETVELFRQASTDMSEKVWNRNYGGFMIGYGRGATSYPAGVFLELTWKNGGAQFTAPETNNARVLESGVKLDQVSKAAEQLNAKYAAQLTALVRAKAHISGTDDYSQSTLEAASLLSNVFVTVAQER